MILGGIACQHVMLNCISGKLLRVLMFVHSLITEMSPTTSFAAIFELTFRMFT